MQKEGDGSVNTNLIVLYRNVITSELFYYKWYMIYSNHNFICSENIYEGLLCVTLLVGRLDIDSWASDFKKVDLVLTYSTVTISF